MKAILVIMIFSTTTNWSGSWKLEYTDRERCEYMRDEVRSILRTEFGSTFAVKTACLESD